MKKTRKKIHAPVAMVDNDWRGACAIVIPIFGGLVTLFVGSEDDLLQYYKDNDSFANVVARIRDKGPCDKRASAWAYEYDEDSYFIRVNHLYNGDETGLASLYHEAGHIAWFIMNRIGLEMGVGGEIHAYLQDYIVDTLKAELRRGAYGTLMPDGSRLTAMQRGFAPEELINQPGMDPRDKAELLSVLKKGKS